MDGSLGARELDLCYGFLKLLRSGFGIAVYHRHGLMTQKFLYPIEGHSTIAHFRGEGVPEHMGVYMADICLLARTDERFLDTDRRNNHSGGDAVVRPFNTDSALA